jgi:hypothetical protein
MMTASTREDLRRQLDLLPDEIVQEVADFVAFILARRGMVNYEDWTEQEWRTLSAAQFLKEADDVEYSLDDAEEIYQR